MVLHTKNIYSSKIGEKTTLKATRRSEKEFVYIYVSFTQQDFLLLIY